MSHMFKLRFILKMKEQYYDHLLWFLFVQYLIIVNFNGLFFTFGMTFNLRVVL